MIDYGDIVPPKRFDLKTYEDFIYVSDILDEYIGCKTYIIETTLQQLNKEFFKRNYTTDIEDIINELFRESNHVFSNKPGLTHRDLEKINSFDVLYHSIKKNGIKFPLSINYFSTGLWGSHPGNTRLFFEDFYTEKVLAVVGDYKGTVQKDYPNIKFMRPNETSFDISELHVILNNTKFGGPNSISRPAQKKKVNYKELTDGPEKVLGDPTLYNPPRTYRLNNNKVYVDDKLILVKDNTWRFSND